MAAATNTTPGEIVLAGDLAGSSNANSPQLTPTGVIPGVYPFASVVVDAKGRVLQAGRSIVDLDVPCATADDCGVIKVPDRTDLVYEDGEISLAIASNTQYGVVKLGPGFHRDCCEVYVEAPIATTTTVGGVTIDESRLSITAGGALSVHVATPSTVGTVRAGTGLSTSGGVLSVTPDAGLSSATTSARGVIQVGAGLTIASGVLSCEPPSDPASYPSATISATGLVQIGTGLTVSAGVASVVPATETTVGGVRSAEVPIVSGTMGLRPATTLVAGGVKIGANLNVDASGILRRGAGLASTTTKGFVQFDSTITYDGSVVSLPIASDSEFGRVRGDSDFTIAAGVLSYNQIASPTVAGFVRVGSGFDVDEHGIISRSGFNSVASTEAAGLFSVPEFDPTFGHPNTLKVNAGVVDLDAVATETTYGRVQAGEHLVMTDGVINVAYATSLHSPVGPVFGVVYPSDSSLSVDSNGALSVNEPLWLTQPNTRTARESLSYLSQSFNGTFAINNTTQVYNGSLSASSIWSTPVDLIPGTMYFIRLAASATPSITFEAGWSWPEVLGPGPTVAIPTGSRTLKVLATSATTAVVYSYY